MVNHQLGVYLPRGNPKGLTGGFNSGNMWLSVYMSLRCKWVCGPPPETASESCRQLDKWFGNVCRWSASGARGVVKVNKFFFHSLRDVRRQQHWDLTMRVVKCLGRE